MLTSLRCDVISSFPLAANDVFTYLNHRTYSSLDLSAYVSFFEIYNGKVRWNLSLSLTFLPFWRMMFVVTEISGP